MRRRKDEKLDVLEWGGEVLSSCCGRVDAGAMGPKVLSGIGKVDG